MNDVPEPAAFSKTLRLMSLMMIADNYYCYCYYYLKLLLNLNLNCLADDCEQIQENLGRVIVKIYSKNHDLNYWNVATMIWITTHDFETLLNFLVNFCSMIRDLSHVSLW